MGSSESTLPGGQVAIGCQYCEDENAVIRHKCIDCDLLLCDDCKRKHHKIKSAKDHRFIEIGQHGPSIRLTHIPCLDHIDQMNCMYCKVCDRLVCPSCITQAHPKHELIAIDEAYEWKTNMLIKKSEVAAKTLEKATTTWNLTKELKDRKTEKIKNSKVKVKNHEQFLKKEVEKWSRELQQELDKIDKNVQQEFRQDEPAFRKFKTEVEVKILEKDFYTSTKNGSEFFQKVNKLIQFYDEIQVPETSLNYNTAVKFIPKGIYTIGVLETGEGKVASKEQEIVDVAKINEYTLGLKHVRNILRCKADNLLVYSYADAVLQNIQINKDTVRFMSIIESIKIYGMVLFNGDIFACTESSRLQFYDARKCRMKNSSFDVGQLVPRSLGITPDRKLIVGAVNRDFPNPGRKSIIIFNERGTMEASYEHDDKGQPIFAYPWFTTSTVTGYIHVSDWDGSSEPGGRVVVLDPMGVVVEKYTGHPDANSKVPFRPAGIVTIQNDNVLVADLDAHHLHILHNRGLPLTIVCTASQGIFFPYALAICDSQHLYIGCGRDNTDKRTWGKLYKVKLVEPKTAGET